MNCPVRTDPLPDEGHNQNPPAFAAELTTNNSLNHRANDTKAGNATRIDLTDGSHNSINLSGEQLEPIEGRKQVVAGGKDQIEMPIRETVREMAEKKDKFDLDVAPTGSTRSPEDSNGEKSWKDALLSSMRKVRSVLVKYAKFVGPGIMISVAYIDPGIWRCNGCVARDIDCHR